MTLTFRAPQAWENETSRITVPCETVNSKSRPMATDGSDKREVGELSALTLPPIMLASSPAASRISCVDRSLLSTPIRLAHARRASSRSMSRRTAPCHSPTICTAETT